MAIKTFTTGEVLTAANTNTYLANSGLVTVGGGSFTNVASFDITGFSSTYDMYQLVMTVGGVTGVRALTAELYLGATVRAGTGYYGQQFLSTFTGTTGVFNTRSAAANFAFPDVAITPKTLIQATISGIGNGQFNITHTAMDNANVGAWYGGYSNYAATNSFDMIRVTGGGGNITGAYQLMGVRKS
jgi:hypothetical protein